VERCGAAARCHVLTTAASTRHQCPDPRAGVRAGNGNHRGEEGSNVGGVVAQHDPERQDPPAHSFSPQPGLPRADHAQQEARSEERHCRDTGVVPARTRVDQGDPEPERQREGPARLLPPGVAPSSLSPGSLDALVEGRSIP
jgi:hypothetical protein